MFSSSFSLIGRNYLTKKCLFGYSSRLINQISSQDRKNVSSCDVPATLLKASLSIFSNSKHVYTCNIDVLSTLTFCYCFFSRIGCLLTEGESFIFQKRNFRLRKKYSDIFPCVTFPFSSLRMQGSLFYHQFMATWPLYSSRRFTSMTEQNTNLTS